MYHVCTYKSLKICNVYSVHTNDFHQIKIRKLAVTRFVYVRCFIKVIKKMQEDIFKDKQTYTFSNNSQCIFNHFNRQYTIITISRISPSNDVKNDRRKSKSYVKLEWLGDKRDIFEVMNDSTHYTFSRSSSVTFKFKANNFSEKAKGVHEIQ